MSTFIALTCIAFILKLGRQDEGKPRKKSVSCRDTVVDLFKKKHYNGIKIYGLISR